ncbi:MAG: hypothetical protein ACI9KN_001700 [Gammaproteobacteria bacterium]|jgi:hypothetical protein
MLALARYALKGPYQAATIVGVLAIVAVVLPLLGGSPFATMIITAVLTLFSGALVGLVILTHGSKSGLKAIVVSVVGITLVATIALDAPALGISIGLAQWLPIVILAQVLRSTKSLAMMMLVGLALAILAVAIQHLVWPDLEASWLKVIDESIEQLKEYPEYEGVTIEQNARLLVHFMVLVLGSAMYSLFIGILLLARWMQARLADSDGFSTEFRAISFGKSTASATIVLLALSLWLNYSWITGMALLVMTVFLYQGIAVVHTKVSRSKRPTLLITVFYMLLFIFPQAVVITAIVGLLDNWLILRKPANIKST